jgi:hypothetical protein
MLSLVTSVYLFDLIAIILIILVFLMVLLSSLVRMDLMFGFM